MWGQTLHMDDNMAGTSWSSHSTLCLSLSRVPPSPPPLSLLPPSLLPLSSKWPQMKSSLPLCSHFFLMFTIWVHIQEKRSWGSIPDPKKKKKKQLYARYEHVEITILRHQPSHNGSKARKYIQKTRKQGLYKSVTQSIGKLIQARALDTKHGDLSSDAVI